MVAWTTYLCNNVLLCSWRTLSFFIFFLQISARSTTYKAHFLPTRYFLFLVSFSSTTVFLECLEAVTELLIIGRRSPCCRDKARPYNGVAVAFSIPSYTVFELNRGRGGSCQLCRLGSLHIYHPADAEVNKKKYIMYQHGITGILSPDSFDCPSSLPQNVAALLALAE